MDIIGNRELTEKEINELYEFWFINKENRKIVIANYLILNRGWGNGMLANLSYLGEKITL